MILTQIKKGEFILDVVLCSGKYKIFCKKVTGNTFKIYKVEGGKLYGEIEITNGNKKWLFSENF